MAVVFCLPDFLMEITQRVRGYAAKHGLDSEEAALAGMEEKSETIKETGCAICS